MNINKEAVLEACRNLVAAQKQKVLEAIAASREAANNETKSSAGDKYETTRAMMHFELEKLSTQLAQIQKNESIIFRSQSTLKQLNVGFGSLVITDKTAYFLAVGLGKVFVENTPVFVLSITSPLGQKLAGKKVGDTLFFNGNTEEILEVI